MPLQQISLDQSIYKKKDTNINRQQPSQKSSANGSPRTGHLTAAGATEDSFTERQKALWAEQDKKQKEEREASMQQAQEIGMRVRAGLAKEQASAQQQQQSVQKQQAEMKAKVEANPEPYAEEQWKFFLSLDDDGQKRFTDQIFAPAPQKSTINGQPIPGGKTKYAGGAIADYWIDKGYVMFNPQGEPIANKPKGELSVTGEKEAIINKYGGTDKNQLQAVGATADTRNITITEFNNIVENSDTFKDFERINKRMEERGYTPSQLPTKQDWITAQSSYLKNLNSSLSNMIDESGKFKKDKFKQDEVGIEFDGERKALEIYSTIYSSYMEYRDKLEKEGADISKYPKLISPEEYDKMDTKPSKGLLYPSTWGKQGQTVYGENRSFYGE